ncbi:MAG: nucleotidyltransferase domain-containing protein [Desulfobulbaceae bacterium]|nr:nucleotidyltransferase domain-containing protein [Desulfobulbaceae bacterium]
MIVDVLRKAPLRCAVLFGSRAKGQSRRNSDIDIAVSGDIDDFACAELASELDELPLPYQFDVINFATVKNPDLPDHILRVGLTLYERASNKFDGGA